MICFMIGILLMKPQSGQFPLWKHVAIITKIEQGFSGLIVISTRIHKYLHGKFIYWQQEVKSSSFAKNKIPILTFFDLAPVPGKERNTHRECGTSAVSSNYNSVLVEIFFVFC